MFVSDSQKPLLGQIQDAQSTVSLPASCPSPAVVDVSENIRSKLYAIFSKMGMSSFILYLLHLKHAACVTCNNSTHSSLIYEKSL